MIGGTQSRCHVIIIRNTPTFSRSRETFQVSFYSHLQPHACGITRTCTFPRSTALVVRVTNRRISLRSVANLYGRKNGLSPAHVTYVTRENEKIDFGVCTNVSRTLRVQIGSIMTRTRDPKRSHAPDRPLCLHIFPFSRFLLRWKSVQAIAPRIRSI